jgi:hypothetical protein
VILAAGAALAPCARLTEARVPAPARQGEPVPAAT